MKKTYVIKNFLTGEYHDFMGKWSIESFAAHHFETPEDAEQFIDTLSGDFIIETIYRI
jgi:hypothetical protein